MQGSTLPHYGCYLALLPISQTRSLRGANEPFQLPYVICEYMDLEPLHMRPYNLPSKCLDHLLCDWSPISRIIACCAAVPSLNQGQWFLLSYPWCAAVEGLDQLHMLPGCSSKGCMPCYRHMHVHELWCPHCMAFHAHVLVCWVLAGWTWSLNRAALKPRARQIQWIGLSMAKLGLLRYKGLQAIANTYCPSQWRRERFRNRLRRGRVWLCLSLARVIVQIIHMIILIIILQRWNVWIAPI